MDLAEAVRIAVERTGHRRFAELLDPAHPDFNLAYEPMVRAIAEGRTPAPAPSPKPTATTDPSLSHDPSLADKVIAARRYLARIKEAQRCPSWRKASCGCRWGECAQGKGDRGHLRPEDCFACLGI